MFNKGRINSEISPFPCRIVEAFWDITQRLLVLGYQRFDTTCWSHLQGTAWPYSWDQQVVPKRRQITTNLRYVTSQKSKCLKLHCNILLGAFCKAYIAQLYFFALLSGPLPREAAHPWIIRTNWGTNQQQFIIKLLDMLQYLIIKLPGKYSSKAFKTCTKKGIHVCY